MRKDVLSIIGGGVAALALAPAAYGASFSADPGSLGPIPDGASPSGYGSPLDTTFTVDGLPSDTSLSDVSVSFQMNPGHTWVGDLDVVLIGPGGAPSQTIFSRVGATTGSSTGFGANIITDATYTFADTAPASPTFWAATPNNTGLNVPAGTYRATTPGGSASGGQNTLITPAFAGVTNPNGVWTLRFRDHASVDIGTVSAAALNIGLTQRTLTVADAGSGGGSVTSTPAGIDCGGSCSTQVDDGIPVTLEAHPAPGSVFTGWSGGGCSGTGLCQVPMHADTGVTANFWRPTLTVAKSGSGGGTVTSNPAGIDCGGACASTLDQNTPVTLTASPDPGSDFAGWSGGGCVGTGVCHTTVGSDTTVTAEFVGRPTLSVTKAGKGDGKVTSSPAGIECGASCSALFATGSTVTLTADPAPGSDFTGWSGGGCSGTGACHVKMSGDQAVQAAFADIAPNAPNQPVTVEITKAKVDARHARATFRYRAVTGGAHSFKCALSRRGEAPQFRLCDSPSRYEGLDPGRYTFDVTTVNADREGATPAEKRFRIKP